MSSHKISYRPPVQYWSGYQTFVNRDSRDGVDVPDDTSNETSDGRWPIKAPRSKEKPSALGIPSDHNRNRQRTIGPTYYNKNDQYPARTKGEPGGQRGNPTKYDYNMPTRRSVKGSAGSTRFMRKPSNRQKKQKGISRSKSKQVYLRNRTKLRLINRKRWLKLRRDPNVQRRRKYYRQYPHRYQRKGFSPFNTPAERTKAWRVEQKKKQQSKSKPGSSRTKKRKASMWPANWNTTTKKTEPPFGTSSTSLRSPNLWDRPQKGLFDSQVHSEGDGAKVDRVLDQTNGSSKVIPRDSDALNGKRVYKEEEIRPRLAANSFCMKSSILKLAKRSPSFRRDLIRELQSKPKRVG